MATSTAVGITKSAQQWVFQNSFVERHMDNAAYEAAHPDDTLVLAGPARKLQPFNSASNTPADSGAESNRLNTLLPVGMLQSLQITQTKPTQPMMAIGSGRSFFVSGKAQTQWSIARLFVNGRNLLRVLYHYAWSKNLDVSTLDDPAAMSKDSGFFINLDSELFYIPFGLAVFVKNKARQSVGAMYIEQVMLNTYAMGINAGQNMIMENVSGMADRVLPWSVGAIAGIGTGNSGVDSQAVAASLDAVIEFSTGTRSDWGNTVSATGDILDPATA